MAGMKSYGVWFEFSDVAAAKESFEAVKKSRTSFPFQVAHDIALMSAPRVGDYVAVLLQMETEKNDSDRVKQAVASWFTTCGGGPFVGSKCLAWSSSLSIKMLATSLVGSSGLLDSFGTVEAPLEKSIETYAVVISPTSGNRTEAMEWFDAIESVASTTPCSFDLVVAEGPKIYMTAVICFFDSSNGTPRPVGAIYDQFVSWLKAASERAWYTLETYGPKTLPPGTTPLSLEGYWSGIQILRQKRITSARR